MLSHLTLTLSQTIESRLSNSTHLQTTDRPENIVGSGKNATYQHFLRFSTIFSIAFCPWVSKN